ncbi:MAG: hypothetical protein Tsb0020_27180 [Haliangiales bacterium]
MSALFALTCALGTAATLFGDRRGSVALAAGGKIAASASFLAFAVASGVPERAPHGVAMMVALVLSAVGDVALIGKSKPAFLAGLSAFLLAHLAYAWVSVTLDPAPLWSGLAAVPVLAVAGGVWRWLRGHVGRLAVPVLAYIAAITAMVVLAAGVGAHGEPAHALLVASAVLFFVSDIFVARQRFVAPGFINRALGLPLYFAAQLGFVVAAAGI